MATQGQQVRDWARANGYEVGIRGRIAPAIWSAYADVHEGFEREAPQSGTAICAPGCGRRWTGFTECHCRRCHRHFSGVFWFDLHLDAHSKCTDPLTVTTKAGAPLMREKETVWGMIYMNARENTTWGNQTDLLD